MAGSYEPIHAGVSLEIVVRIYDTFDNNLGIENDFYRIFEGELLEVF